MEGTFVTALATPLYPVTYDLRAPEHQYSGLIARLHELQAVRTLNCQWFLRNTLTPSAIADYLLAVMDLHDRMSVSELYECASYNLISEIPSAHE